MPSKEKFSCVLFSLLIELIFFLLADMALCSGDVTFAQSVAGYWPAADEHLRLHHLFCIFII